MAEIIGASSGASWIFEDRMTRALRDDFEPRAAARPLADAALARFRETVERGWAELDDAAVIKTYRTPRP